MRGLWSIVLLALVLPYASAELLFSQPSAAYNFGDELQMNLLVRPATDVTDFATIDLRCSDKEVTLFRSLVTVSAGSGHDIALTPRLDSPLFHTFNGTCTLHGHFGSDDAESQSFILTSQIDTTLVVPTSVVGPGDSVAVSGTARKANGQLLEGFARLTLVGENLTYNGLVNGGSFSFNITLPANTRPGEHILLVEAYEENNQGVRINSGSRTSPLIVRVVLTRGDVAFDHPDVTPGDAFEFTLYAYDQADSFLERDVHYDIYQPNAETPFVTRLTKTGVREWFNTSTTSTAGYWKIEASVGDLLVRKLFYVNERELVTFMVENNDTLVVTNAGNVPYHHTLEILIGNASTVKDISVGIGESRRFKLKAPEAVYDVSVRDGNHTFLESRIPLTGRAISVGELGGSIFNVWWAGLFILVLLGLTFMTNMYIARKRTHGSVFRKRTLSSGSETKVRTLSGTPITSAYVAGGKEHATVIALRADTTNARVQNAVDAALGIAQSQGAHIKHDTSHHLITLSPRFTRKLENDLAGIQLAKEIESSLKGSDPTGSFAFGIGVGKGEIISDASKQGHFTSLGSFIPATKRLANSSKNEVLVSDDLHAALRTQLKAEKVAGVNGWRITSVVNRDSHKNFIDGFLRRHKG